LLWYINISCLRDDREGVGGERAWNYGFERMSAGVAPYLGLKKGVRY